MTPEEGAIDDTKGRSTVFDFPHLVLGVICIFAYVGVEVIAIDTIGLFGQYMGFDLNVASKFGIYSLIALTVGYLLGIVVIPKYLKQRNALIICCHSRIHVRHRGPAYPGNGFHYLYHSFKLCTCPDVAFHLATGD